MNVLWTPEELARLLDLHGTMPLADVARALGRTPSSVRGKLAHMVLSKKVHWTAEEEERLAQAYSAAGPDGVLNLPALAAELGRHKTNVCRKAREMGLGTNPHRRQVEVRKDRRKYKTAADLSAAMSEKAKRYISENGHPRGMLGKRHSAGTLAVIAASSADRWAAMTDDERSAHIAKGMQTRLERYGSLGAPQAARGSWKAGWREIGGKRNFYRSRWEANYARYLEWLKVNGAIAEWQHEPETFWFEAIKRGVRSYLPDFRVWENDGSSALHEVKGWMDARSRTTIARMAKYHPKERLIVIDGPQYRAIRRKALGVVPGWEDAKRDSHA